MSLTRRMSEPVRAPIRQLINHYTTFFEDLIHAVKSELVAKIDRVNARVDDVDRSVSTSHEAIADQMALQAATLRSLGAEVERLQDVVTRLGVNLDGDGFLDLAVGAKEAERPTATHTASA
ncbi:MAG: hypothetical protein OEV40_02760 [Acidimicrobiia bacterium]|nr:hypothetical protein [Acidimicrobiia bacterium]